MTNRSRCHRAGRARDAQRVHPGRGRGSRAPCCPRGWPCGRFRGSPGPRLAAPGSVLIPAGAQGPAPNRQRLAAALAPLAASRVARPARRAVRHRPGLGRGAVLPAGSVRASSPHPARSCSPPTAALSTLGPSARFTTRVVSGAARLRGPGRRRRSHPRRGPAAEVGLPAAGHARVAGGRDGPLAARARRTPGAAGLRHLAVHRAADRAGLEPQLHQHRQRHPDHLARGGPGAADARRAPRRMPTTRTTSGPARTPRQRTRRRPSLVSAPGRHSRAGRPRAGHRAAAARPSSPRSARPCCRRSWAGCCGRATT